MKSRTLLAGICLALATVGCGADPQSAAAQAVASKSPISGLDVIPLQVQAGSKRHNFRVEVARTEQEQARGLMYRPKLGAFEGMLFPFPVPRAANFWMMNTPEPLDLLFIRTDGTIARVAVNAVPYSTDSIAVNEPVGAVLEIAGGRSVELGIEAGHKVSWSGGPTP